MSELPGRIAARALLPGANVFGKVFWDLSVMGRENLPLHGPMVLASNHFSHIDPPLVGMVLGRLVRFIALDELFGDHWWFDRLMLFFGAIPTDRDGYPVAALRTAVEHLRGGGAMGVFPEGARVVRWRERPPKRGAAWLAWMSGAPLVPVAIHGSDGTMVPGDLTFRRTAVKIWIGEPLWWHRYADRVDPLGAMMDDWAAWVGERIEPWTGLTTTRETL